MIDTRNEYEVKIGSFPKAVNPMTSSFKEFPSYVEKELLDKKDAKIAMFCTGGVRCEKASAYMKRIGFDQVYSLKGGILRYLQDMPEKKSTFQVHFTHPQYRMQCLFTHCVSLTQGSCFVFDRRTSVEMGVKKGRHEFCFTCRSPLSPEEMALPSYQEGVQCLHCEDVVSEKKKSASLNRHKNIDLARKLGDRHLGKVYRQAKGPAEEAMID